MKSPDQTEPGDWHFPEEKHKTQAGYPCPIWMTNPGARAQMVCGRFARWLAFNSPSHQVRGCKDPSSGF